MSNEKLKMKQTLSRLGDNNAMLEDCITVLKGLSDKGVLLQKKELASLLSKFDPMEIKNAAFKVSYSLGSGVRKHGLYGLTASELYNIVKQLINEPK